MDRACIGMVLLVIFEIATGSAAMVLEYVSSMYGSSNGLNAPSNSSCSTVESLALVDTVHPLLLGSLTDVPLLMERGTAVPSAENRWMVLSVEVSVGRFEISRYVMGVKNRATVPDTMPAS